MLFQIHRRWLAIMAFLSQPRAKRALLILCSHKFKACDAGHRFDVMAGVSYLREEALLDRFLQSRHNAKSPHILPNSTSRRFLFTANGIRWFISRYTIKTQDIKSADVGANDVFGTANPVRATLMAVYFK